MERRVAAGVLIAVVCTSTLVAAVILRLNDTSREDAIRLEATVDALDRALGRGAAPQQLLDAFAEAGWVGGVMLYDANGAAIARAGHMTSDASAVVCRSVAFGAGKATVCVEPARSANGVRFRNAAIAAAGIAMFVAIAAAIALVGTTRRHLRGLRGAVEKASADGTYARRLEPMGGESGPLVDSINSLLAQIQSREADLLRRTHDLESANRDLESFAHTISHDLRGPLGSVLGFADALRDAYGDQLDAEAREYIRWILESAKQMQSLIDGLLSLSRLSRAELHRGPVDLSAIASGIATSLAKATPEREVEFKIRPDVVAEGDEFLLRAVLENLIANAWKFTGRLERAVIEFGVAPANGHKTYFVRDNGAGFDPTQASKMFRPFQRLHSAREFEGTGIGLATVQRILQRHGGKAWAEGEPGQGATIFFTTG